MERLVQFHVLRNIDVLFQRAIGSKYGSCSFDHENLSHVLSKFVVSCTPHLTALAYARSKHVNSPEHVCRV